MPPPTFPVGQFRYPNGTNLTADAGFTFTNGRKLNTSNAPPLAAFPLLGAQGVEIAFGANGAANNDAFTARIFTGRACNTSSSSTASGSVAPDIDWHFFGSAVITLSSSVIGVAGGLAVAADYMADTIVWTTGTTATTPVGVGQAIETAMASPGTTAFSPADDATEALLVIPHLGWADFLCIDMDPTTGATKAFALIARI